MTIRLATFIELVKTELTCLMIVFLLHNIRHVPKLKIIFLSTNMFGDLGYFTRIKHGILKISHDRVI